MCRSCPPSIGSWVFNSKSGKEDARCLAENLLELILKN